MLSFCHLVCFEGFVGEGGGIELSIVLSLSGFSASFTLWRTIPTYVELLEEKRGGERGRGGQAGLAVLSKL